jgi:hypothetical protein
LALSPRTRLGVYEVTAQIGEGGMGQVYRARDTKLNREVALKVLSDSFANDVDRPARFTREAQTLASLNHPHIAAIYGIEESGGVRALVMELVEGDDAWRSLEDEPLLATPMKPASRLPWVVTVALAVIAAGVSFVHFREAAFEPRMLQYTLAAPEKMSVSNFAISPDGRTLASTTTNEKGSQLWLRSLNSLQAQALNGTEGANYPFWSPDSRFIGFFAEGKLQKVEPSGTPSRSSGGS